MAAANLRNACSGNDSAITFFLGSVAYRARHVAISSSDAFSTSICCRTQFVARATAAAAVAGAGACRTSRSTEPQQLASFRDPQPC